MFHSSQDSNNALQSATRFTVLLFHWLVRFFGYGVTTIILPIPLTITTEHRDQEFSQFLAARVFPSNTFSNIWLRLELKPNLVLKVTSILLSSTNRLSPCKIKFFSFTHVFLSSFYGSCDHHFFFSLFIQCFCFFPSLASVFCFHSLISNNLRCHPSLFI